MAGAEPEPPLSSGEGQPLEQDQLPDTCTVAGGEPLSWVSVPCTVPDVRSAFSTMVLALAVAWLCHPAPSDSEVRSMLGEPSV